MTRWLSLLFAFLAVQITASEFEVLKGEIAHYQEALKTSESEQLHYDLALAYFHDQEIDKAFRHFLLALKEAEAKEMPKIEEVEKNRYDEALAYYLDQSGSNPICVASELVKRYADVDEGNIELRLLIATAYANLGQYDLFFKHFYDTYPYLKDSFLAYKIQGILYLRLSHHSRLAEQRHAFQQEALDYLSKALDLCPNDASLYKVLMFLAKNEKNDSLIQSCLQKMADNRAPIARGDIYLYVRESVRLGEYEVGQKIIDHASLLYDYSRAIAAAQDYLNQHKG